MNPLLCAFLALSCAGGAAVEATSKPNILFIMADDLNADWKNDRLDWMPNLKQHFKDGGTYFENHVAAQPVCGPSRSSLLLGRYPHNTGYLANSDPASTAAFLKLHNNTNGKWLTDTGYYTAFFGKYVNGCEGSVPSGWSYWGGLKDTYNFYNATIWEKDWEDPEFGPPRQKVMTHVHQADFLANFTVGHAAKAVGSKRPFFISVTPVMPHWGTCYGPGPASVYPPYDPHWEWTLPGGLSMPISPCPTNRNRHAFDNATNPRIAGVWNVSIAGPRPVWHKSVDIPGHLTAQQAYREDIGWQNRSASLIDLDDMIGKIVDGIATMGQYDNTIMVFTSDNGYHLGEHKMPFGKGLPYDTDVRLPMYVRGPGVIAGRTLPHPTNHIDFAATFVELAGAEAHAPSNLDGLSFASELGDATASPAALGDRWRQHSYSEFFSGDNTWRLVRVVNSTHKFSYMWWCTNDTEVFDVSADQWQKKNLYGSPGFAASAAAMAGRIVNALGSCSGADCSHPVPAASGPTDGSLQCYTAQTPQTTHLGAFNIVPEKGGTFGIKGWLVDTTVLGGNGTEPVIVWFKVDGKFYDAGIHIANIVADLPRPDIPTPSKDHGFVYNSSQIPAQLFTGKHSLTLFGRVGLTGPLVGFGGAGKHGVNPGEEKCVCNGKVCPCATY